MFLHGPATINTTINAATLIHASAATVRLQQPRRGRAQGRRPPSSPQPEARRPPRLHSICSNCAHHLSGAPQHHAGSLSLAAASLQLTRVSSASARRPTAAPLLRPQAPPPLKPPLRPCPPLQQPRAMSPAPLKSAAKPVKALQPHSAADAAAPPLPKQKKLKPPPPREEAPLKPPLPMKLSDAGDKQG